MTIRRASQPGILIDIAIQFATFFGLPRFRFASGGGTSTGLFFINERSSPDIETMCVYSYIRWTFASG
jgi:hypothetical protein